MGIISRHMQKQIRKYQQETGESAKCFSGISLTKEVWLKLSEEYGIPENPLENEDGTGLIYWESTDGKVRLLTRGNPMEADTPVGEVTVYAKPEVIVEIMKILPKGTAT